jgi:hypothetical protein
MKADNHMKGIFAVIALAISAIGGSAIAQQQSPETTKAPRAVGKTIPLEYRRPIPLSVESAGVQWRGQDYHLVSLRSIQFHWDLYNSRLRAEVKADVRTFANAEYDVSAAVFDASGQLLGAARGRCDVPCIIEGKSTIFSKVVNLDFGVSFDYSRAASFMISISRRKVLTPDEWKNGDHDDAVSLLPRPMHLSVSTATKGWRSWQGMGDPNGSPLYAECLTSISADTAGGLWVGTSRGRLFLLDNSGQWTQQANLRTVQITGIAVEGPEKVWLSTNDGLRRLSREGNAAKLTEYHRYYQGHPQFVSGAYIPNADGVRLWGYVDRIYVPPKNRTYSPLVVSGEHGLFCFGAFHEVWDHFMAHYWGGNSDWLDIREVIPHRRPTQVVEDAETNLWVGTEWDGLVRFNARGRDYYKRSPPNNTKDGTEFSFFGPKEVGCPFDRVVDLKAGLKQGVWAVITRKSDRPVLARFDGNGWSTFALPSNFRSATCIAEIKPGVVLVGTSGDYSTPFMFQVDWNSKKVDRVPLPPNINDIFEIVVLPSGRIFAISWSGLYEKI